MEINDVAVEIADLESKLEYAQKMKSFYFWLLFGFAIAMIVAIILLSSDNSENISKINKLNAEVKQLTIEKNVLLQVRCAEDAEESDEEITLDNAFLIAQ